MVHGLVGVLTVTGIEMKGKGGRIRLWWVVPILVIAACLVAYFLITDVEKKPEKDIVSTAPPTPREETVPPSQPPVPEKQLAEKEEGISKETDAPIVKKEIQTGPAPEVDPCTQIEQDMAEFFHYLNQKTFVRHLSPEKDSQTRFKEILRRLVAKPPIPAGEGIDPRYIIENVYHFFRVLDREDLRLMRGVLRNEEDTMEINLEIFYRWLMPGCECPDPEALRPPPHVVYEYAGFFMNTIGGRTYLFRRSSAVRLLVSYYCLMIVHEADKKGRNTYGIDVLPLIEPLKREINYFPGFQFQSEYIDKLNAIQNYYLKRR